MYINKIRTISTLVRLTGVSRTALVKLYNESNLESIKIGTYKKVCDGINCNLSDLIEYNSEINKVECKIESAI